MVRSSGLPRRGDDHRAITPHPACANLERKKGLWVPTRVANSRPRRPAAARPPTMPIRQPCLDPAGWLLGLYITFRDQTPLWLTRADPPFCARAGSVGTPVSAAP